MSVLEPDGAQQPARSSPNSAPSASVSAPSSGAVKEKPSQPAAAERAQRRSLRQQERAQQAGARAEARALKQDQRKSLKELKAEQRAEVRDARSELRRSRRRGAVDATAKQSPDSKRTYKSAELRREQILDCALEAFAEHGYHGTSIGDICKRANIGRATLYQYFTDKRAVLLALVERVYSSVVSEFERRQPLSVVGKVVQRPSREQGVAFMRERLVTLLAVVFEDEATTRLILRAARGADGVVDELLRRLDDVVLGSIEAELTLAMQAGLVRPLDVGFVARFFVGGLEKVVMRCIDDEHPLDIQKVATEAALLEGIGILAE